MLKPQLYDPENVLPKLKKKRQRKQKLQHDRKPKELPPLRDCEVVRVREPDVQGAIMAATFSRALRLFTIFSVLFVLNAAQDSYNYHSRGVESPWLLKHILSKSTMPKFRVRRPVVFWGVHGLTLLAVPEKYIMLDITIDMDVESQPGPETGCSFGGVNKNYPTLMRTKPASLEYSELLSLRNRASKPSLAVLSQFKSLGILKYRG